MGTVRKCEVISFQFKIEVCRIGTNIIGFHGSEIKLCGRKVSFQACQQLLSRHVRKIAKKKKTVSCDMSVLFCIRMEQICSHWIDCRGI